MGNKTSRVAPTKSLHIFDTQTRTRYKNQREGNRLRLKVRDLQSQHHDELSRLAFDQQDLKMQLHELHYDKTQRDLYKSFDQDGRMSKPRLSNLTNLANEPPAETSSLLLHNLHESRRQQKSNTTTNKPTKPENKNKPLSAYENFQLRYASKTDVARHQIGQTEKTLVTHTRSLQKETELMKKSIKTAVARAARDSNMVARRDAHVH